MVSGLVVIIKYYSRIGILKKFSFTELFFFLKLKLSKKFARSTSIIHLRLNVTGLGRRLYNVSRRATSCSGVCWWQCRLCLLRPCFAYTRPNLRVCVHMYGPILRRASTSLRK